MEIIIAILFITLASALFIAIRLLDNAYKELEKIKDEENN